MELPSAARRHLMDCATVRGYVQDRVWRHRLEELVDQTGQRALVLVADGGWTAPNMGTTQEFPLLTVECWADCSRARGDDGRTLEKTREDAVDNAWAVYRAVDTYLHPFPRGVRWGSYGTEPGLLIIGGQRFTEPSHYDATKPDGSGRQFGESAMVRVQYALQVAHETRRETC